MQEIKIKLQLEKFNPALLEIENFLQKIITVDNFSALLTPTENIYLYLHRYTFCQEDWLKGL